MRTGRMLKERPGRGSTVIIIAVLALLVALLAGCASPVPSAAEESPENPAPVELNPLDAQALEQTWGLRLLQARLTAQGGMVDLRFMVVEPDKAKGLQRGLEKAIIVEESSGRYTWMAHSSKVGSMRDVNLDIANRVNYILFVNPGRMIQTGSSIVLISGEVQLGRLTVQ